MHLRRCISHKVHSADGPANQPTNRFRDIRKSPRSFSFRLFVTFRFPSIHGTFSLFSLPKERAAIISPLAEMKIDRYFLSEKGLRTIRDNLEYDLLLESFASIVSKWSSDLYVRKKPFSERCARDLSCTYRVKYGCAITNYICLTRKLLAILYLFNDHINMPV